MCVSLAFGGRGWGIREQGWSERWLLNGNGACTRSLYQEVNTSVLPHPAPERSNAYHNLHRRLRENLHLVMLCLSERDDSAITTLSSNPFRQAQ